VQDSTKKDQYSKFNNCDGVKLGIIILILYYIILKKY